MVHLYWRKWTHHSIKKWNNSIKARWQPRVQVTDIRGRSLQAEVKHVHRCVQQSWTACDGRLGSGSLSSASASPVLTSLSHPLILSLPSDPQLPCNVVFHFLFFIPGSFPSRSLMGLPELRSRLSLPYFICRRSSGKDFGLNKRQP